MSVEWHGCRAACRVRVPSIALPVGILLLLAVAATPGRAHHSVLGFDGIRAVNVTGTVHEVIWANPHVYIAVDSDGAPSVRWVIEAEGVSIVQRLGWTHATLRPGDRIHSAGAPARDGRRLIRCDYVERDGGDRLPCVPAGPS
jgi:hypothetical protein